MSIYDAFYFFGIMQLAGFVVGLAFSMFFSWPKW